MKIVLVRILKCEACGQEYMEGSPPHLDQIGASLDKMVESQIMRDLELDNVKLREALVGLTGADGKEGLDNKELGLRAFPVSDEYRVVTLKAIQALRDTLP